VARHEPAAGALAGSLVRHHGNLCGQACPPGAAATVEDGPARRVRSTQRGKVEASDIAQHRSIKAEVVSQSTVRHGAGEPPLIAFATTVHDFTKQADGSIDVTIELLGGQDAGHLSLIDSHR
jgi:hypothetical protein